MHQIAYFESPKCKNSVAWEGDTQSHTLPPRSFAGHPPLEGDAYFENIHFPINLGIDNIPTNSPEVCTRSLTLSPQNAKTPWCGRGDTPLPLGLLPVIPLLTRQIFYKRLNLQNAKTPWCGRGVGIPPPTLSLPLPHSVASFPRRPIST